MQILVLGMHRSGTSAVTRIVNMLGASLGDDFRQQIPDTSNPRGYWERLDLQTLDTNLLRACDGEWFHPSAVDLANVGSQEEYFRDQARQIVERLSSHRPWVVKDPRMCLLLPFWRGLLDRPVGVLVYRHPVEIARSMHKRDGIPLPVGVAIWQQTMLRCLHEMGDIPFVWVSQERMLTDPMGSTRRLYEGLKGLGVEGLDLPPVEEVEEFIDIRLHRSRQRDGVELSAEQKALWDFLQSEPVSLQPSAIPPLGDDLWSELYCDLLLQAGDVPARIPERSNARQEWWEEGLRADLGYLGSVARSNLEAQERLPQEVTDRLIRALRELEPPPHANREEASQEKEGMAAWRARAERMQARAEQMQARAQRAQTLLERYGSLVREILSSRRWRRGTRWMALFPGAKRRKATLAEATALEAEMARLPPISMAGMDPIRNPTAISPARDMPVAGAPSKETTIENEGNPGCDLEAAE